MSYSIVQYTGDGATATWSVPFPYISKSDVSVKVAGVAATFTWPTTSTVTITPTPANGAVIEIKRSTSPGTRVVDFSNGANLTEADLDNSALQMFYMAQEAYDLYANAITLASDGKMDAQSKKIKNVTDGVEANEAVTKGQLDAAALAPVAPAASSIANTPAGNISSTTVQAALNELDTEKATLASAVMDGDAASGDLAGTYPSPTIAPGLAFSTGDVKLTLKTAADTGWVLMNDTTIGDASSGASGRANADTSALFTLLWTNTADTDCPVSGGRGGSAAADFAAHKTLALPRALGRALANYGAGSTVEAVTASSGNGFVVGSNNTRWITGMPVVLSNLTGFTTSATAGPTYYVVRISATNIRLATTLALAQAGTPDVTISGSGTCTLTYSLTNRALGAWTGEEAHAMSSTELLSHTHPLSSGAASNVVSPNQGNANGTGSTAPTVTVGSTGGNAAANIMQPTLFLNVMVKL